ncbi:MAG: sulfatase activating formylglycine-generating enzyme [Kiritimatiellia bacterium]|jgi:formylglycine-generating enzyme required for sulfatase activity
MDDDKNIVNGIDDRTIVNMGSEPAPAYTTPITVIKPGYVYLNRYKVIDELGKGAMGVVYRCYDEVAGIDIALKAIPPELSRDAVEMEAIRNNFQLVHRLHHPGIANANTLEKDQETGDFYLIMECVEGVNFYQYYKSRGYNPSLTMALPVLRQIAEALDYAHVQKIIHRDIKPSNIQITTDGVVKILDFGLAQQIQSSIMLITGAGSVGTPYFMSPEQWKGHFQDAATDQYAFAVVIYQLIAGKCPFQSADMMVLREMVSNEKPPKPDQLNDVEWKVLRKALEKERIARYSSCTALVEKLEQAATLTSSSRRNAFDGTNRVGPGGKPFSRRASKRPAGKSRRGKRKYRAPVRELSTRRLVIGAVLLPVVLGVMAATGFVSWEKVNQEARNKKAAYIEARRLGIDSAKARDWETALKYSNSALAVGVQDTRDVQKLKMVIDKATSPRPGTARVVEIAPGMDLELVWIPSGKYLQGSFFDGNFDEEPAHMVMISKGFWMSTYEVSQEQYAAVTGQRPSENVGTQHPVDSVSWKEAVSFTDALRKDGLSYRLPTEAEWEYAARAGRQAPYYFGTNPSELHAYANFADASITSPYISWQDPDQDDGYSETAPVGSFKPNTWGLYDMSGNVAEWCWDYYSPYLDSGEVIDPRGPESGEQHIARGGSWASAATYCRSAARKEFKGLAPENGVVGLRVVLDAK